MKRKEDVKNLEERLCGRKVKEAASWLPAFRGYKIIGALEHGTWMYTALAMNETDGSLWVFKYLDPTELAKKQMRVRGWSIDYVIRKMSGYGTIPQHENIAAGSLELADDGKTPFYKERFIDRFLTDYLSTNRPSNEDILRIIMGISSGISAFHTKGGSEGKGLAHGDLVPKNIGYTTDGEVVISDFGLSTRGEHVIGKFGSDHYRVIDRPDSELNPTKKGDIFLIGQTLYYAITRKFIFSDEVELHGNAFEQRFASQVRDKPKVWDAYVDEKIAPLQVASPIKQLLRACLCHESKRIEDGAELAVKVNQAKRKYEASKPKARIIRYARRAALALAACAAIYAGVHQYNANERLKHEAEEQIQRETDAARNSTREYDLIMKVLANYEEERKGQPRGFSYDHNEEVARSRFHNIKDGLRSQGIDDISMSYSYMINPLVTYNAIKKGVRTYNEMVGYLLKRSDECKDEAQKNSLIELYVSLIQLKMGGCTDAATRHSINEQRDRLEQQWQSFVLKHGAIEGTPNPFDITSLIKQYESNKRPESGGK